MKTAILMLLALISLSWTNLQAQDTNKSVIYSNGVDCGCFTLIFPQKLLLM